MKIVKDYAGDASAAKSELKKKYASTYWYYSLYNNPKVKMNKAQQ